MVNVHQNIFYALKFFFLLKMTKHRMNLDIKLFKPGRFGHPVFMIEF